jgi:hypothetical protein
MFFFFLCWFVWYFPNECLFSSASKIAPLLKSATRGLAFARRILLADARGRVNKLNGLQGYNGKDKRMAHGPGLRFPASASRQAPRLHSGPILPRRAIFVGRILRGTNSVFCKPCNLFNFLSLPGHLGDCHELCKRGCLEGQRPGDKPDQGNALGKPSVMDQAL